MFSFTVSYKYQKYVFLKKWIDPIGIYTVTEDVDMLTKRSTSVDQILESERMCSKLSIAISTALRTLLGAQKSSVYGKNGQKRVNP